MAFRLILLLLITTLTACASSGGSVVDGLREGMDKDEALRTAGDPKRTFRSNGQDHWIYVHFKDNEEFSRIVTFEEGKIVKIGRASPKKNWDHEMEKLGNSVNKPK